MPRTLPWQVKSRSRATSASPSSGAREIPRKSLSSSNLRQRSPSRSSVAEPPGEEYMREGFDKDDIYVMVEDEFLATAGTFTRHLHEAEYARRKKEARIKNATAIGDIARPIDPKAPMSAETKMNIRSKGASAKHKAALDQIRNHTARPPVDSELERGGEDDEDDADDPWIGTQLQALMTSPRRSRALVGLQGVKSTTRAALGYTGSSSQRAPRDTSPTVVLGDRATSSAQAAAATEVGEETSSGDDDDLGVTSRPKAIKVEEASPPRLLPGSGNKPEKMPEPSRIPAVDRPHGATEFTPSRTAAQESRKPSYTPRINKLFDDFDDNPPPRVKSERHLPKKGVDKQLPPASSPNKPRQQDRKSRKDRLSQVPTFL